jgi:hypothetical protein
VKQSEAKDFIPLLQAWAEGKTLQTHMCGDWRDIGNGTTLWFDKPINLYRIKPSPKLRAWKPEEVPVGAKFRCRNRELTIVGAGVAGHKTFRADALFLSYENDNWYPGNYFYLADCLTSESKPEYSLDGGKTWLPCGVMEDSQ